MNHPLIDAHMHVYPAAAWGRRRTHDHSIEEYGPAEVDYPSGQNGTLAEAAAAIESAGLTHGVVLNLFEPARWQADIATDVHDLPPALRAATSTGQYLVALNLWLSAATASLPQLLPVAAIDATALGPRELADHVEYLIRNGRMAGVKLHPILQRTWPNDPRLAGVWEVCTALEVPVIIHSGLAATGPQYAAPAAVEPLIESFPRLRVVMAHLGGGAWSQVEAFARRYRNVWFDCSEIVRWIDAPLAPRSDRFITLVRAIGAERVLYGSDYPWYLPVADVRRLKQVSAFSSMEFELILGASAAQVFSRALAVRAA